MKNILIKFVLFVVLSSAVVSCTLTEDPKGFVSPDSFYKTESEVNAALYGVYGMLHNIGIGDFQRFFIGDLGTDIATTRDNGAYNVYTKYEMGSLTAEYRNQWRDHFNAIGATNMLIARTEASTLSESFKIQVIGEAKFMRAFFYNQLVLMWGDVPMWLEELDLDKVNVLPRTPKADVLAQIYKDLEDAARTIAAKSLEVGRTNSWAAKALHARVALLNNQWQKAYDLSKEITTAAPYSLVSDIESLFNFKNINNSEFIFWIPKMTDIKGAQIHSFCSPRGADENNKWKAGKTAIRPDGVEVTDTKTLFEGWGIFNVLKTFYDSFDDADSRKSINGWSELIFTDGTTSAFNGGASGGVGYYTRKWSAWGEKANNGSRDIQIIRLGEIYLILAEAANELGKPTEALAALNTVRQRAFSNTNHNITATDKESIKTAIINENKWELAAEGLRRWYLNHWGYDYLKAAVESVKHETSVTALGAENIRPHHVLFMIPPEELIKNPNLTQNTGY